MFEKAEGEFAGSPGRGLGRSFRRVGRIGFWTQIFVALLPIILVIVVFGTARGFALPGARFPVIGWFAILGFAVLLFTIYWSWRYQRIGRRLEEGTETADAESLSRTVWIGLGANAFGVLLSLVVVVADIVFLFVVFLEAPQGGAPVFQTMGDPGVPWISAADVLSLLALILTAAAEIVTLLLALWLLYRLSPGRGLAPAGAAPEGLAPRPGE